MSHDGPTGAADDEDVRIAKLDRYKHLLPPTAQPLPEVAWPPIDDETARDRAVGCLLGLAIGDAVGAAVTSRPRGSFLPVTAMIGGGPHDLAAGEWTANTTMAVCLAQSLAVHGTLDQYDFMTRLRDWLEHGEYTLHRECFGIGVTTRTAIERFMQDDDPAAGSAEEETAGNGSLVRSAPVAMLFSRAPIIARFQAVRQSRVTHGTIECLDACELLTAMLVDALNGADFTAASRPRILEVTTNTLAINGGDWKNKDREAIRASGYVIDTLEAAVWAVGTTNDFRDAVLTAVNLGDAADGVGAVAGQLAGALYGASSIPPEWLECLAWKEEIEQLALELMARKGESA